MIFGISACNSTKKLLSLDKSKATFSLEKGSCFGKCSVYNLYIYPNKQAIFEGIANTEIFGIYEKKITDEQYQTLQSAFEKADFYSFKDDYPSDIIDFPLIKLGFKKGNVKKEITGKNDRPQAIMDLQLLLENIVYSKDWNVLKPYENTVTSGDVIGEERKTPPMPVLDNQIIIEPNENMFLAKWIKKYEDFNVKLVKKIAPNLNLWVITFDKSKIDPKDFLETIQMDPDIKSAQFNAKISPREH